MCEALGRIGSARCVPALARCCRPPTAPTTRAWRLNASPSPRPVKPCAPRSATAPDAAKSGIANSLGARRDPAAVPLLAPLLAHADGKLSAAAALALGRIGTPAALAALSAAGHPEQPALADAILRCVESPENLGTPAAGEACRALLDSTAPATLRGPRSPDMRSARPPPNACSPASPIPIPP
ncbi:MAG: HEAT repeat domain-containing protein [Kiritimatiellia bacterium]